MRCAPAIVSLVAVVVGGCATTPGCPPGTSSDVVLTCQAALGNKGAQLALGKAYEMGDGVPLDIKRAARLYQAAARPTRGVTYVYSPAVGQARAQVLAIRTGEDQPGLPEAMYRLGLMYRDGRGVRQDQRRADALIAEAKAGGYSESK